MARQVVCYVDTYSGDFVVSDQNPEVIQPPRFTQGDTFNLQIYLLLRNPSFPNGIPAPNAQAPYSILDITNGSLKVALGPKIGDKDEGIDATPYATQFTWTKDGTNTSFSSTFALNTEAIAELLGIGASAQAYFEIEYTDSGLPWTVLSKLVTVQAEVISTDTLTVPVGLTPLSLEQALATFLERRVSGVIYLEDINNPGHFLALYNENGSLKADPVQGTIPP